MKRSIRFKLGSVPLGIAVLAWTVSAGFAIAQQTNKGNPLRPASTTSNKVPASTSSTKGSAITAVGTAVRNTEKRTPEIAAAREKSVLVERPSPRSSAVSQAAYRRRVSRTPANVSLGNDTFIDNSVLNGTVTVQQKPNDIIDGGLVYEDGAEPMVGDFDGFDGFDGFDDCGSCDSWDDCCFIPCPRIPWDNLTVFGGAQGYTGPKNGGQAGSFGFHEGVNWGAPLPCSNGCLGMQLGGRFAQSNLSGAEFSSDTRHQAFVTAGLFRRVDCGLQYGAVLDYLSDDWYTNTNLTQLRAELAWVFPCGHELGFWMTQSMDEDTATATLIDNQIPANVDLTWESTDLYAFYYRHRFSGWEGATGRLYAGFTGASDGYLGTDFQVPLSCDLALQAGFAYLIPEEAKGPFDVGNEEESWNLAVSLVWYPGCGTSTSKSYFAPLFNVADNGSFMVDRLQ